MHICRGYAYPVSSVYIVGDFDFLLLDGFPRVRISQTMPVSGKSYLSGMKKNIWITAIILLFIICKKFVFKLL